MLLPYELPTQIEAYNLPVIDQHIGVMGYRPAGSRPWRSFAPRDVITPAIPQRRGWYDAANIDMLVTAG